METTIFCFSGTGNSYYVAAQLATQLENCTVRMIPSLMDAETLPLTEQVGFVFPVYKGFPPNQVREFLEEVFAKQDLSPIKYMFLVATRYKFQAYTFGAMELLLREAGCLYSYANHVVMPDGYVPLLKAPTEARIEKLYATADEKIAMIADDIKQERFRLALKLPFTRFVLNTFMDPVHRMGKAVSQDFLVTDACTSCGLCYRTCPSGNITMIGGKPQFGEECVGCLGCYHRCPTQAIVFNHKVHSGRYPNKKSGYHEEYRN